MFPKINIFKIIRSHFSTLVRYETQKASWTDWLTFLILPLSITAFTIWKGFRFSNESVSLFIAILSILAGFSLNLLAIVFGYKDKIKRTISENEPLKSVYLKEIHHNISFSIINSLFCILFLLLTKINFDFGCITTLFNICLHFITMFFIIFYGLTILMILKRMSILFSTDTY